MAEIISIWQIHKHSCLLINKPFTELVQKWIPLCKYLAVIVLFMQQQVIFKFLPAVLINKQLWSGLFRFRKKYRHYGYM